MKATDAWRAKLLVDALAQWKDLESEFSKPPKRTQHRAFEMSIGDLETDGPQPNCYVYVDDRTGRKIVEAAKKIIEAELKLMGVSK